LENGASQKQRLADSLSYPTRVLSGGALRQLAEFGFGVVLAAGYAMTAFGQNVSPSDTWEAYLRPGCHVVLMLPSTELAVQTKWLGPITLERLRTLYHGACPSDPVKIDGVEFGRPVLDVLKIQTGLGRDSLRLYVYGASASDDRMGLPPRPIQTDQNSPIEASIEMRKYEDQRSRYARHYDIRYRSPDEALSGQVSIDCAGYAGSRNCGPGPFPKFAGLVIRYRLSQWHLPVPEVVSTDPTTEPGAILQFDQRFREWLISLERPR
jgi:hypothetical protein